MNMLAPFFYIYLYFIFTNNAIKYTQSWKHYHGIMYTIYINNSNDNPIRTKDWNIGSFT